MSAVLAKHIQKFIRLSEDDLAAVSVFFKTIHPKKKEKLLVAGSICKFDYFVEKGCLRLFFVNNKGIEKTTQFAIENWWLADYTSFQLQLPSEFYIQAVEKSSILAISYESREKMLAAFPQMERYFRLVHQKAHAASQFRIKFLSDLSKEELFHHFNEGFPEFVQRVPQHLLASFLGITPEYLSELRARRIS